MPKTSAPADTLSLLSVWQGDYQTEWRFFLRGDEWLITHHHYYLDCGDWTISQETPGGIRHAISAAWESIISRADQSAAALMGLSLEEHEMLYRVLYCS